MVSGEPIHKFDETGHGGFTEPVDGAKPASAE